MAGLRGFTINLVGIVLAVLMMVLFTISFLGNTNPDSELLTNTAYGLNQTANTYNSKIQTFNTFANQTSATLGNSQASATDYLFLIFKGAFTIPIAFLSFIGGAIFIITNSLSAGLAFTGIGETLSIIIVAIGAVLTVTAVLLIIKAIRTGESER